LIGERIVGGFGGKRVKDAGLPKLGARAEPDSAARTFTVEKQGWRGQGTAAVCLVEI
jgi:hypothetical protein